MKTHLPLLCSTLLLWSACSQEAKRASEPVNVFESASSGTGGTAEQGEVRDVVERFLFVAGNYDLDAMNAMMTPEANLGIAGFNDGVWTTRTTTFNEYFESTRNRSTRPYYEPVREYVIHVTDGRLAFVKADAILHQYGVPSSNNIDYFTLIKEDGEWRFINISFKRKPLSPDEMNYDPVAFGTGYARAWCSQKPEYVALFFSEEGSLSVNDGTPAVGRTAIAEVARGFMTAFPDMVVTMDSLRTTPQGSEFHWTLRGANTGPGGTGNRVVISGIELWQLDADGRIRESKGQFDADDYERQRLGRATG